jgi:uncharacterized protein (DUF1684 family)
VAVSADVPEEYVREIQEWRGRRVERLRSETGWLTVVGLVWLEPGENRFGTGEDNRIVLPEGTAPEAAGSFFLEEEAVRVRAEEGVTLTLDDQAVTEQAIRTDHHEDGPDVLRLGDLSLYIIERSGRFGVRIKDPNHAARREFQGLDYYPIDPAYRMRLELVPYDPPKEVSVPNVLGTPVPMLAPGYVEFQRDGKTWKLTPVVGDPSQTSLFFIFGDLTNGAETYGAGRFLYGDLGEDGVVDLDFNKAYNPPCVFTPFATCPLPPKDNRLTLRIEAGEKKYGDHS